jgi:hypothetical protein
VGSSVYGTAALARNVADTYNFDVAGIVTGYGFWNWIIEALDGWFVLGQSERENLPSSDFIARSPDIKTLIEIILTIPPDLKYLVGHSKGSLMIDFVLRRFVQKHLDVSNSRYSDLLSLNVRTLGAVVSPPEQFTQVRQFMGQLDYLGNLNSHMFASYEEVPGAGHHLNPKPPIPLPSRYLDVCEVLLSEQDRYPKKNVSPWFWPPLPSRGVETA